MKLSGLRHLGYTGLDGRPDGLQVVGTGSRVFVSHLFSNGVTEVDLADPRRPRVLGFIGAPPGSWSVHLQVQGDLLMVANGPDMWSAPAGFEPGRTLFSTQWQFAGGVRIFDVSVPGHAREIGFADVGGAGVHRLWFDGSDQVYASAFPSGFPEAVLLVFDVSSPDKPVEVQRYWLPGLGPGEDPQRAWGPNRRVSLHHATLGSGYAYGAWRDGGITVHAVNADGRVSEPSSLVWDGPYGDGCVAHTAVRLPGTDLVAVAEEGIEDAGQPQLRVVSLVDMSDPPSVLLDPRPGRAMVASTNDVFVTAEGLLAVIDANRGLDVLELALP